MGRGRIRDVKKHVMNQYVADGWAIADKGWPDFICQHGTQTQLVMVVHRTMTEKQRTMYNLLWGMGVVVEVITVESVLEGFTPRKPILADGEIHVEVWTTGTRFNVRSPMSEEFRLGSRQIRGRWMKGKFWSFHISKKKEVADLITRAYGAEHVPEWMA